MAPGVAITPDPAAVTAGDAAGVTLTAAAAGCPSCRYAWAFDAGCPINAGKGTATTAEWVITAGLGGSEVISTAGKTAGFSCEATVTSTDEYDATSTATRTVQVGWVWGGGGLGPPPGAAPVSQPPAACAEPPAALARSLSRARARARGGAQHITPHAHTPPGCH